MKVYNMKNPNGNKVANQFVITDADSDRMTFQSYNSEIVTIDFQNHTITVGDDWDYSNTTGKYRNLFMRNSVGIMTNKDEFRKALEKGGCVDDHGTTWVVVQGTN